MDSYIVSIQEVADFVGLNIIAMFSKCIYMYYFH